MANYSGFLFGLAGVLLLVCILVPISRSLKLSFTVTLAVLGMALGFAVNWASQWPVGGDLEFFWSFFRQLANLPLSSETFLKIFLPLLLFEAAIALNLRSLASDWLSVSVMAVLAVLVATVLGGLSLYTAGLPNLVLCLLIASIVATTDPVAVIGIFREAGVSSRLTSLIEGESLLNDAAAIAVFVVLFDLFILAAPVDVSAGVATFVWGFAGGAVVGVLFGWLSSLMLDRLDSAGPAETTVSVAVAYMTYIVANDYVGVSGVVAVVFAGLIFGHFGRLQVSGRNWVQIETIWKQIGFWASSLIIVLALMSATPNLLKITGFHVLLLTMLIAGMLLARAFVLFALLPFLGQFATTAGLSLRLRAVAWWGGLRGAVTLALALSVSEHFLVDEATAILVSNLATGFVLFTLLVQGTTLGMLVRVLGLQKLSQFDQLLGSRVSALAGSEIHGKMEEEADRLDIEFQSPDKEAPDVLENPTAEQATALAINILSAQEIDRILEDRAVRLSSRPVARFLVADAGMLRDAARQHGVEGYRKESMRQLSATRIGRGYLFLHRRFGIEGPLARQLAKQFERSINRHRIFLHLQDFIEARIRPVLGEPAADQSKILIAERKLEVERQLDTIKLQYPDFWARITQKHLRRISIRMEYEFYRRLEREGLLSPQLWRSLGRRMVAAHRSEQKVPDLDLGLDLRQMIRKTSFFAGLDDSRIERLIPLFHPVLSLPGEKLIAKGSHGDRMFIIESGALEVVTRYGTIRLGSGDIVGEMALLFRRPRTADVVSLTYSRLLCLARDDYRKFLVENPDLMSQMRDVAKARAQSQREN